jgi:hypothetical protein
LLPRSTKAVVVAPALTLPINLAVAAEPPSSDLYTLKYLAPVTAGIVIVHFSP